MPQRIAKNIVNLLKNGLNWLLPPLCPATGAEVDALGTVAPEYWATLRFIRKPYCNQCALPFPYAVGVEEAGSVICAACMENPPRFGRGRSALVYDDASRRLVVRFKHGDQLQAIHTLVPWLCAAGQDILAEADVLVPVPLHRWRLLRRRYNQSALLARAVAKACGKDVCVDALLRKRATPPQASLDRKHRAANVKGAFCVNPGREKAVAGRRVVLLDDVLTTGATLNACTDALLGAGAASVDVLTIARVPKD